MSAVRATALRAGGACVRCRKGKTKCVYENGRAPCKNCAKGLHECYLPSESMSHGGHGVSPARTAQRARETLPSERASGTAAADRHGPSHSTSVTSRNNASASEKYVRNFFLPHTLSLSVIPLLPTRKGLAALRRCHCSLFSCLTLSSSPLCTVVHTPACLYFTSVTRSRIIFGVAFQPFFVLVFDPFALFSDFLGPRGGIMTCTPTKNRHVVELVKANHRGSALYHATHEFTRLGGVCFPFLPFFFFSFFFLCSKSQGIRHRLSRRPDAPKPHFLAALKLRHSLLAGFGCRPLQCHADPAYFHARALPTFLCLISCRPRRRIRASPGVLAQSRSRRPIPHWGMTAYRPASSKSSQHSHMKIASIVLPPADANNITNRQDDC